MPLLIFDNIDRTDTSSKGRAENDFAFLNRTTRAPFVVVRSYLETALALYPGSGQAEMVARIRSGDNAAFKSAVFELVVFDALSKQGFALEPHPVLPNGSTKRPDFLVTCPEGNQFYVECVLTSEINQADPRTEALVSTLKDKLNERPHHYFMLEMDYEGALTDAPGSRRISLGVSRWLDSLDVVDVRMAVAMRGLDAAPTTTFEHRDWTATFRAIPLSIDSEGTATRLIGVEFAGRCGQVDRRTPLKRSLQSKGSHYGKLTLPFLICINIDVFNLDQLDELQALFGDDQVILSHDPDAAPRRSRAVNGFWIEGSGPRYRHVSAVWFFADLRAHTVANREPRLYLNPWSIRPLPRSTGVFAHWAPVDSRMEQQPGLSFVTALGLGNEWDALRS